MMSNSITYSIRLQAVAFLIIALPYNVASQTLQEQVEAYYKNEDCFSGIRFVANNYEALENDTYANYLLGEMGMDCKNYKMAKKGYERVLMIAKPEMGRNIHEKIHGSNETEMYWGANDGLGYVYYALGDYKKSLASLEEANKWLKHANVHISDKAKHYYNLACAYSLNKKFEKSVDALSKAIQYDSENKERARNDSDFEAMREFLPYIALVKE